MMTGFIFCVQIGHFRSGYLLPLIYANERRFCYGQKFIQYPHAMVVRDFAVACHQMPLTCISYTQSVLEAISLLSALPFFFFHRIEASLQHSLKLIFGCFPFTPKISIFSFQGSIRLSKYQCISLLLLRPAGLLIKGQELYFKLHFKEYLKRFR